MPPKVKAAAEVIQSQMVTGGAMGASLVDEHYGSDDDSGSGSSGSSDGDYLFCCVEHYLHLPELSLLMAACSSETRLKALDVYSILLRAPERVLEVGQLCRNILVAIDSTVSSALDTDACWASDEESPCTFVDSRAVPFQIAQRATLLWARSLRCFIEAATEDDDGCRHSSSCGKPGADDLYLVAWTANGLGRNEGARQLVELLADDDQRLVEALLDLAVAFHSLQDGKERDNSKDGEEEGRKGGAAILAARGTATKRGAELSWRQSTYKLVVEGPLHPMRLFVAFAETFEHDERAILDLILSNETKTLEYLLRILRLPPLAATSCSNGIDGSGGAESFSRERSDRPPLSRPLSSDEAQHSSGALTSAFTMLGRLHCAIKRAHSHGMFPYNPRALLARIETFLSGQ